MNGHDTEASRSSFASEVRGTDAHEIDAKLAWMAADVYRDPGSNQNGWRPLSEHELAASSIDATTLVDPGSGFAARIYTDDQGRYVLAFRGTDEGSDWKHNLRQGLGFDDIQYREATQLARKASAAFGENLVITGHSLGGGLATMASFVAGAPAVTFNAAGLNEATLRRQKLNPDTMLQLAEDGLIRRYAVHGEILTHLQEKNLLTRWVMPDARGHKIEIPDPHPLHGWESLLPGNSLKHSVGLHGAGAVIESMELATHGPITHPANPANGIFNQALGGLHGIQPNALGFNEEAQYRNAAGALTVKAREAGMQRIDHVVVGANGALFAVEGPLEDASHRIASVDRSQAAAQSIEVSSQLLQAQASQPGTVDTQVTQQQQQQQRNRALAP